MQKTGFDNDKYLELQSKSIKERISRFGDKLYLEFGGKLFDDYHASRVLPGFLPDSKINMLMNLKDEAEVVVAINASDIQKNKLRGDHGIPYDQEVLRLIDAFRERGLYVGSVVITQYNPYPDTIAFEKKLDSLGIKVYRHFTIKGYPSNISLIISDNGYGLNEYIETQRQLIVVTGPGPGSGKMAVCLSQLYHDNKCNIKAGYAKFETFPIWNLPLKHPVNLAYEAATTDLKDVNMIDPFHLEAYGNTTINYNRDIEIFPVLNAMFQEIYGHSPYKSPTDMGVNMAGYCIFDNNIVESAAKDEIIRRYYKSLCTKREGFEVDDEIFRMELIMKHLSISKENRPVVSKALAKQEETAEPATALELLNGKIVTGKTSSFLGASSALLLNALKELAGIDDSIHLISPSIIEPIQDLKVNHLGNRNPRLHMDEVLIALSICAVTDEYAKKAIMQLKNLKCCEAHSTVLLSQVDKNIFNKLGINLTCEPVFQTKKLYQK